MSDAQVTNRHTTKPTMNANHAALRLALTELIAVTLWVSATLFLFCATNSPLLHSVSPLLKTFPSFQVFLSVLVVAMAIWELLGLSFGSPFNPVVTLSQAIARKHEPRDAATMILAQFQGHIFGVLLVRTVAWYAFSEVIEEQFHPPQPHESLSYPTAIVIEGVITAVLCAAALSMDDLFPKSARLRKFSIMSALVVAILALFAEWTGSCMNPAMSFALSLLGRKWSAHVVYWVGPVLGAVAAGLWYDLRGSKQSALRRAKRRKVTQLNSSTENMKKLR